MRCYRHLDRPFVVFLGLGPGDLMAVLLVGVVLLILTNPIVTVIGAVAAAVALKRVKEGKPRGYLFTLAYRSGLLSLVPDPARPPYLVRPPALGKNQILRFSSVSAEDDDERPEVRFFRGPREFRLDHVDVVGGKR